MKCMVPARPIARHLRLLVVASACLIGTACRIEQKAQEAAGNATSAAGNANKETADLKSQVAAIWDSKVIPTLSERADDFVALRAAMRVNIDNAGASHGNSERGLDAPWNFATRLKGKIIAVDTESGAGKIGVDVDGDAKVDAVVQIGPVLFGTSLRDSLSFISFTGYTNQIEYAELANAFNNHAYESALKALAREKLQGRSIELLGTFTTADANEVPTITPAQLKLTTEP